MPDLGNDVSGDMRFARRRDTDRLMVLDIEGRSSPRQDLALAGDDVRWLDLIAELGHTAVDRDQPGLDQSVGFTPRTDPLFGKELIDADRLSHGEQPHCRILKQTVTLALKRVKRIS